MQTIDIAPVQTIDIAPVQGGMATKGEAYVPLEVRQKRLCLRCGGVVTVTTVIVLMLIAFTAGRHSRAIHGTIRDAVTGTHPDPPAGKGMGFPQPPQGTGVPQVGVGVGVQGKGVGATLAKGLGSSLAAKGIGAPQAKGAGMPPGKSQGSPASGARSIQGPIHLPAIHVPLGKGVGTVLEKGAGEGPSTASGTSGGMSAPVPDESVIKGLSEDIGKSSAGEE